MKFPFTKRAAPLPPLQFHNTMSNALEIFIPLSPGKVKMYNCGPTVYDQPHIGNLRSYIFADTLRRTLDYWHYSTNQVINITDVGHLTGDNLGDADIGEDRMEASASKRGLTAQDIAQQITQLFFDDLDALEINRKRITFPRATEYIEEQISLVHTLEEKGYAYKIDDGIYFDTSRFPQYGALGHVNLQGERESRIEENAQKRNPYDFALWKFSKKGEVRQQEWPSPWGVGFPGWHIECTAMIFKLLGKQIDIHTGGIDHIPIHHNNEIAQAEAITGKQYVRYWMHNAFITVEGKRIGKSLGNSIYLHNIVDKGYTPRALRYWFSTGHYRSHMNFTWDALEGAHTALLRLHRFFFEQLAGVPSEEPDPLFMEQFHLAMAHDLDTPKAIALVWELVRDSSVSQGAKKAALLAVDPVLSLGLMRSAAAANINVTSHTLPQEVQELMGQREEARKEKAFMKADELRKEIEVLGYIVTDGPEGSSVSPQ